MVAICSDQNHIRSRDCFTACMHTVLGRYVRCTIQWMKMKSAQRDQLSGSQHKLQELKDKLKIYEEKLAWKMKFYRGVIHESASSELKHAEVMVLCAMIDESASVSNLR